VYESSIERGFWVWVEEVSFCARLMTLITDMIPVSFDILDENFLFFLMTLIMTRR